MDDLTEVTLASGERLRVQGAIRTVESAIVSAARGSILELAWLTDARTAEPIALNPEHVLMLRPLGTPSDS